MASVAAAVRPVPRLPSLNVSSTSLESETIRPTILKETSTVGDLISFTDRGPRRASPVKNVRLRRRSVGDDAPLRKKGILQRQGSLKGLPFAQQRYASISPQGRLPISREEPRPGVSRRRKSRRDSMLNALREDLEKIPCLRALKRFSSVDSDVIHVLESDAEDDPTYTFPKQRSRTSSVFSRLSDSSQEDLPDGVLTENEVRKLRMLQTLNRMGRKKSMCRKTSMDSMSGEIAVLEASFLKGRKRGSIATHVLMKARKRRDAEGAGQSKSSMIIRDESPQTTRSEADILAEAQKEKSQKIFQMLKRSEKPKLVGITGDNNQAEKPKDTVLDGLASFRKRLRRKKVPYTSY